MKIWMKCACQAAVVLSLFAGCAKETIAGLIWFDGMETRRERSGLVPDPLPGPGPAVRPPGAALSAFANSGDVPVPNWAGVEVETDITHRGTGTPTPPLVLNHTRIARAREFVVDSATRVQIHAAVSGMLDFMTGADPAGVWLQVRRASSVVERLFGPVSVPVFSFDGSQIAVDVGDNTPAKMVRHYKAKQDFRELDPGLYRVTSDLLLDFTHVNATVSHRYLDPLVGPDGLSIGVDELGLEGVLREVPEPNKAQDIRTGTTAGSSGNPTVSYDSATQVLSFATGMINIADLVGGLSGGVDPLFASDPIVGAVMAISDLIFQGFQPDGSALFSGGTVTISDGALTFFEGSFPSFRIEDTMDAPIINSFGILESFSADSHGLDSPFLESLFASAKGGLLKTTDFYFTTPIDLAMLTQGFTQSASIDATYYLGGSTTVPEPSTLAMGGIAVLFILGCVRHHCRRMGGSRRCAAV